MGGASALIDSVPADLQDACVRMPVAKAPSQMKSLIARSESFSAVERQSLIEYHFYESKGRLEVESLRLPPV